MKSITTNLVTNKLTYNFIIFLMLIFRKIDISTNSSVIVIFANGIFVHCYGILIN